MRDLSEWAIRPSPGCTVEVLVALTHATLAIVVILADKNDPDNGD